MKLLNALSLTMTPADGSIEHREITETAAREALAARGLESYIGHPATAAVLSCRLGMEVGANRAECVLGNQEDAIVCRPDLPRLAEGQVLSEEEVAAVKIRWWWIRNWEVST